MTVSFNPLKTNGELFIRLPELDDVEFSLSNANAADVLNALGIEDAFSASPWPLPSFKASSSSLDASASATPRPPKRGNSPRAPAHTRGSLLFLRSTQAASPALLFSLPLTRKCSPGVIYVTPFRRGCLRKGLRAALLFR